jgi:tRNA(Ile2) C34 agmatinyltransferase TiaS
MKIWTSDTSCTCPNCGRKLEGYGTCPKCKAYIDGKIRFVEVEVPDDPADPQRKLPKPPTKQAKWLASSMLCWIPTRATRYAAGK